MSASPARHLVPPTDSVLSDAEFDLVRSLIYDTFGIALNDTKRSLVVGRLYAVLQREGIASFDDYIRRVRQDKSGGLLSELVNRISTNHTFFNRERIHFDYLRATALKDVIGRREAMRSKELRVWCAASSYGHEAYMLAMIMRESIGVDYPSWSAGLLATDINDDVLHVAKRGVYPEREVEELPTELRRKYFTKRSDGDHEVSTGLRDDVTFRRFNLMNRRFPFKQPFDIIFCRNVMIYFDVATKAELAAKLFEFTNPGGYLFVGAAESLPTDANPYTKISPGVYRKKGAAQPGARVIRI
ncbi:MAG: protein-glutamate O-methyltransferase CheR [Nannocystaceae bacterium]